MCGQWSAVASVWWWWCARAPSQGSSFDPENGTAVGLRREQPPTAAPFIALAPGLFGARPCGPQGPPQEALSQPERPTQEAVSAPPACPRKPRARRHLGTPGSQAQRGCCLGGFTSPALPSTGRVRFGRRSFVQAHHAVRKRARRPPPTQRQTSAHSIAPTRISTLLSPHPPPSFPPPPPRN